MKRVTVQFDIDVPDTATDSEIEAWVSFHVGASCQLAGDNPMADQDLDAVSGSVWLR
jgi:hypothetical protein